MTASQHGHRTAVKAAGSIAVVLAVAEAANLAARSRGEMAGAAVVAMAFLACWIIHQLRQILRPVPRRSREPQLPAGVTPVALADGQEPARLAA